MSARITGKSPDGRECPRCSRKIGGFFYGTTFQFARHKNAAGKPCRYVGGQGGDRVPDSRGCAPCNIIDAGGSALCRTHKRAGLAKGAVSQTRELITKLAERIGVNVS